MLSLWSAPAGTTRSLKSSCLVSLTRVAPRAATRVCEYIYSVCCIEMSHRLNGNVRVDAVEVGESVLVNYEGRDYLLPKAFVQPYVVPGDGGGEEKTITGGEEKREKEGRTTVVFFNEFDLFGDRVDPLGVAGMGVSKVDFADLDIPLVVLLREARGSLVWKEKTDPGLFLYSAYKDRDVWVQNTILDPSKSLRDHNLLPEGGRPIYIMVSSKKPRDVNQAFSGGKALPASLRGLGVKLGQPKVW